MQLFINNWSAVLTAPATASAVSLSVPLADAAKLTGLGAGDHYLLTLAALDGAGIEIAWEIVKVTGAAAGVLTVQRAQEGTTAIEWESASVISARATKGTLEELRAGGGTAVGNAAPQPLGTPAAGTAPAASREDHVHAKPSAADIGAATAAQGAKADTAVQPAALASGLASKVDKDGTKVLSDQNYTAAEKAKLAGIEAAHFKGLHASLAALQAAHPTAAAGNYADVDSGAGADVARYIWDVSDSKWLIQSGATGSMTAAQIKTAYESNPDTNGFSDAEQSKLGAIAPGATANATDAQLRDRSTHTGSQAASTISDLAAAVRGVVMTGVSFVTATAGLATDSLLVFLGKLQAQINGLVTTVAGKQDALVSGTTLKTVNGTSLLGAGDIALEKYRGLYVSLAALNAAVPTASAGDYADVDSGSGSNVKRYIWDTSDTAWVEQTGGGAGMSNPMTTAGDIIVGGSAGVPNRLAVGAAGKVLGVVAGSPAWVDPAGGGGGLTNFTEAKTTASPNATIPVVSLAATSAEANVDFALIPKGSGALTGQVPDGSTTGGGKRGIYSVDLQRSRTGSTAVAEGQYAVVAGGADNRAAGNYSVSAGGQSNNVSAPHAVSVGGLSNTVSGYYGAVPGGQSNNCSGQWGAIGGGQGNVVDSTCGYIPGGAYATTRGADGAEAYSSGRFSATGDSQRRRLIVAIATSSATATKLTSNRAAAGSTNQLKLADNSTYAFTAKVVARSSSDQAGWSISGLLTRGSGAATTVLVGSPVVTSLGASAGASSWSVSAAADTSFGALSISATGGAGVSIKWVADVETVEVVG